MSLKDKNVRVFMATPGCGKSYLADRYENVVDVDEVRLMHKYVVPKDINRKNLEATKGNRFFERQKNYHEDLEDALNHFLCLDKIILIAPHPEIIEFFKNKNEPICFVYPKLEMKNEIVARFKDRGNSEEFIKENEGLFEKFYEENCKDNKAEFHIQLDKGEYLSDILKKEGYNLIPKDHIEVNQYIKKENN